MIDDLYLVLKDADSRTLVFETSIPSKFKEHDAMKLLDSLHEYININPNSPQTTIDARFKSNHYSSFYDIYQDIKIASSLKIKHLKIGSQEYNDIDFFYKFCSELLIRESGLAKMAFSNVHKSSSQPSELEQQVNNDFQKISSNYTSANDEVITDVTEIPNPNITAFQNSYQYGLNTNINQQPTTIKTPLFTSLVGKSELDPRLTLVPNDYGLAKVVPLLKNSASSGLTFDSVSHASSKIPFPNTKPILEGFHVLNWLPIGVPEWLTYKGKLLQPGIDSTLLKSQIPEEFSFLKFDDNSTLSFGPTIDSKGFGIPSSLKASVWLNRIGLNKIDELRTKYFEKLGIQPTKSNKPETNGNTVTEVKPETKVNDELTDYDQTQTIKIEDLLSWDPIEIKALEAIKNDKSQISASAKNLQNVITRDILNLNKLRQARYAKSEANNILPVTNEEIVLYKKITKLITLSIKLYKVSPKDLPLQFSKKIPVLMTEYSGTLPGVVSNKPKNTRLASLKSSLKKKR